MATRMQVTLDAHQHGRATARAAALGISLAEYIRRVLAADLDDERGPDGDISEIFGIGDSGGGDVAAHEDAYLAAALAAAHVPDAHSARSDDR